jgi:hypothetical protein
MVWGLCFERVPFEVRHLLREYVTDHAPTVMSAPPPPRQTAEPSVPPPLPVVASHRTEPSEGTTDADRPRETIRGYRSMISKS